MREFSMTCITGGGKVQEEQEFSLWKSSSWVLEFYLSKIHMLLFLELVSAWHLPWFSAVQWSQGRWAIRGHGSFSLQVPLTCLLLWARKQRLCRASSSPSLQGTWGGAFWATEESSKQRDAQMAGQLHNNMLKRRGTHHKLWSIAIKKGKQWQPTILFCMLDGM